MCFKIKKNEKMVLGFIEMEIVMILIALML